MMVVGILNTPMIYFCMYSEEQMFQIESVDDPIFVIVPICGQVDMQTHLRLQIAAEYVYLCKILFHCQQLLQYLCLASNNLLSS